ncbi:hypothetical protein ALI44B_00930 [Leifsonia sp. ALI-44-B]|uniref:plasmid mobilization relaxosome protein MobC n=1 Tax=Leifsonia sp. ALI-44-B TaxID=1933776 RepID=UPI00097C49DC|nr:plasmid mobilization relaxosome protein MobC [Leifsonia sp. ALI-44-B]ONI65290.1 hypothetical protein ALI44B_00930 [Leifsonia sp. ALI-44-B]
MSEEHASPRMLDRKRRANAPGGRRHFHQVKVTAEEEGQLLLLAAERKVTVPRLLVESALADQGETSTDRRELLAGLFHARRLLSSIANNVNQIARASNAGEPVGGELAHTLSAVNLQCQRIDNLLDRLAVG